MPRKKSDEELYKKALDEVQKKRAEIRKMNAEARIYLQRIQEKEQKEKQQCREQAGEYLERMGLLDWFLAIPQPDLDDLAIMPTVTERLAALMALEESRLQVEGEDQEGHRKAESDQNSQRDNGPVGNDAIEQSRSETAPLIFGTEDVLPDE